ncbi:hypothetical protein HYE82_15085 [Streptomyces sp. BR123]|uniref:hypothetical protein n=1 Tax=Streptomyces sp. BR123 TaxID=2749828 RepID=UPI0015C45306|nr:hypothetical protein [Streptomyces sp. BR123]NXY95690.1 hypothetical protein [Streptomyces sp. BR123]
MKKLYAALLAGTAMAFIGLQGVATAAPTGWPTGCYNHKSPLGGGWLAVCSDSNGGHYRATVICERWDGGGLIDIESVAWKNDGTPSFAACPPRTSVKSGGIVTRSH